MYGGHFRIGSSEHFYNPIQLNLTGWVESDGTLDTDVRIKLM